MDPRQFYIAVAIGPVMTTVAIFIGFLLNNARLGDSNNRINELKGDLKDLLKAYSDRNDANLRRVEDMLLGKFAELDTRLSRIEAHLNLR